ncbi:hypothetical protein DFH27DRAFT_611737 [Peziza echinospora]|nr:hypothetical protein DFH27DRAFT_611737 [Peziza echinospora]
MFRTKDRVPSAHEIKDLAAAGHKFTAEEVRDLTACEQAVSGLGNAIPDETTGPRRHGPAATAQSIYDAQQNYADLAEKLVGKPENEISRHDAKLLHSLEARASGGDVQPPKGSLSSQAQKIVDKRDD